MERRLGRGLGSLLGEPEAGGGAIEIELGQIRPNPFQPRKTMDPAGLEELRDSIQQHGLLQPVVVRRQGVGFELIAGERRWRAARLAGLQRITAVVKENVVDADMLELALVENVQRRDLDPLERARGYRAMMDALSLTQDGVAAKVGLKRATVANHLRLLDLPSQVQEAVGQGLIQMGHARAILGAESPAEMLLLLEEVVRGDLSVREVEQRVRKVASSHAPGAASADKATRPVAPWIRELEARMRTELGTKVRVENGEGFRGRIVLEYFSREELDRICERLAPKDVLT